MLTFDPASHTYRWKGELVPNLTRILEPLVDYSKVDPDILAYKSELGSAVHLATALDDRRQLDEEGLDERVAPYLAAWRKFRRETEFIPITIEEPCYSVQHGYATTPDRAGVFPRALVDGTGLAMLEIKTTAELHPVVGLQLAGQQAAHAHNDPDFREAWRYAVQLRPDGTYRMKIYGDRGDFSTFLSQLNVFRWRQRNE